MKKFFSLFLATFRLNNKAICKESNNKDAPWRDYHDYPDAIEHEKGYSPLHWFKYHCKRCGKEFEI